MDNVIKKPYEISLWEDELIYVVSFFTDVDYKNYVKTEEFNTLKDFPNPEGYFTKVIKQYYKEKKVLILGSDTMNTPIRAFNPKLQINVNGSASLTFSIYYQYYDEDEEEFFNHPYIQYLVNERKIKLRYGELGHKDTKWYDLIIKDIQEDSTSKTFTYTAKDMFINELSKSGFNLEFSPDLENNIGNIKTLAERTLEESDWKLRAADSFKETTQEPLYKIQLSKDIKAIPVLEDSSEAEPEKITIKAGDIIYAFYSVMSNEEGLFQFLYREDGNYTYDDDYVVDNAINYYYDGTMTYSNGRPFIAASINEENGVSRGIFPDFQGKRYVHSIRTEYDSKLDKYITVYQDKQGKEVYGYTETEYISSSTVRNYITSPSNFSSYSGWKAGIGSDDNKTPAGLRSVIIPDARDLPDLEIIDNAISYLGFTFNQDGQEIFNSGFADNRAAIKELTAGDKYVFKAKYGVPVLNSSNRPTSCENTNYVMDFKVREYAIDSVGGDYLYKDSQGKDLPIYFSGQLSPRNGNKSTEGNFVIVESQVTLSYEELITRKVGIFITLPKGREYLIEEVSFFKYVTVEVVDEETNATQEIMAQPGDVPTAVAKTKYYYYDPKSGYTSLEDIQYLYSGYTPSTDYLEMVKTGESRFEKVRSIEVKESNRFNIIQTLCELFECWAKFEIEHNEETGEILLGRDKTWLDTAGNQTTCPEEEKYRQQKFISFKEYVGDTNDRGFRYGINLKSIKRALDSSGAVSKIIVKNNSNEFAEGGFCTIANAKDNPSGENFIYDFGYYISQRLLNFSEINNDLYDDTTGHLGYYKKLKIINNSREVYSKELGGLIIDIANYEADETTYKTSVSQAEEQLQIEYATIYNTCLMTFEQLWGNKESDWWENETILAAAAAVVQLRSTITAHSILATNATDKLTIARNRKTEIEDILKNQLEEKKQLHSEFNQKYSRFIQEGSWISEEYLDDNLYFLDAKSTLHTSSQPQVTYTIDVLELSRVEGYEGYVFNLGDKTFIEDTEFFGWTRLSDGSGFFRPRREEIVVTEITYELDSPEKNQVKVQNYKTQFEDLFSRITAATQAIEYSTGQYNKATSIVEEDGTIKLTTLQNSIANNSLILSNSSNQSVVWDSTGITTTNLTNPSEKLRIVSGGLFISNDGGITWRTGVRGDGVVTDILTSGQLDTEKIYILNGSSPSFRWDKVGINAFNVGRDGAVNQGTFVRFDQYGIYGVKGVSSFDPNVLDGYDSPEEKIKANADFSLTWSGFQLRSNRHDGSTGYLSISSEKDLQVFANNMDMVHIGGFSNGVEQVYGMRLKDKDGGIVMQSDSSGLLYLSKYLRIGPDVTNSTRDRVKLGIISTYNEQTENEYAKILSIRGAQDALKEVKPTLDDPEENLAIYDDGTIIANKLHAQNAYIEGEIHASGGTIGGLSIESWGNVGYEVEIVSNSGVIFQSEDTSEKTLTAVLYRGGKLVTGLALNYQWFKDGEIIIGATDKEIKVKAADFDGTVTYTCEISLDEGAGGE